MNSELFSIVFRNQYLKRLIFDCVHLLHKDKKPCTWDVVRENPRMLVKYDYFDCLKEYIENCRASIGLLYRGNEYSDSLNESQKKFYQQLGEAMSEAVRHGYVHYLQYFTEELNLNLNIAACPDYNVDLLERSATSAQFHTTVYLAGLTKYNWNYAKALLDAPIGGSLEIVKFLSKRLDQLQMNKSESPTTANDSNTAVALSYGDTLPMDVAAEYGRLEIVIWLHENRTEGCTSDAMDFAAMNGHLNVVRWLHENRTEGCTNLAMDFAAANDNFSVVQWLHYNRTEGCTTDCIDGAASTGRLEMIKWLHENRTEGCTPFAMARAAYKGRLDVVKWLHENRTEGCTTLAMDHAAYGGHIDIIKWLHRNRTEGCTLKAIVNNQFPEVVKWLKEHRSEFRGLQYSPNDRQNQ